MRLVFFERMPRQKGRLLAQVTTPQVLSVWLHRAVHTAWDRSLCALSERTNHRTSFSGRVCVAALVSGGAEPLAPCWQCRALWRAFEGLKHQGHVAGLCGSLELRGSREKRKHRRLVFREKADGRSDEAWGLFQAGVLTAGICKAFGMVAALQGAHSRCGESCR